MPDGDRVHPGLVRAYIKVYKQLCEGQFDGASLAIEAVDTMKRQLQKGGDAPAHLVEQIAQQFTALPKEPILRELVNWGAESHLIEQMAAQIGVSKRISEQIIESSKALLYDIRQGAVISNPKRQLMERMLKRLYTAEFEERVPMAQHYQNVTAEFVQARLDEMRPHAQRELAVLARRAAKRTSFQNLRGSSVKKASINLHETDVLSLN